MAFINRLKDARIKKGLTQEKLAAKIGVAKSTYTGYEKGNSEPNMLVLSKIMGELDVDANYLYQDEIRLQYESTATLEEMERIKKYRSLDPYGKEAVDGVLDVEWRRCEEARKEQAVKELHEQRIQIEAGEESAPEVYYIVPAYISPMSAGTGQPAGDDYPENYRLRKAPPRGTSYIAPVSGHSMEPTFHNGDLVFVHAQEVFPPLGKIGVFLMDGQQYIKERGDGVLVSHNPAYDPLQMMADTHCQGLVLGVCDDSYF